MSRFLGVLAVSLLLLSAVKAPAADVPLPGKRARLSDDAQPRGRRTLLGLSTAQVGLAGVDPTRSGATLSIYSPATGQVRQIVLPAAHWVAVPATRPTFRYGDPADRSVRGTLAASGQLRFTLHGTASYRLGTPQTALAVRLAVGDSRLCTVFGGRITRDDGVVFVAADAPAPAGCPLLPGESTTTTAVTTTTDTATTSTATTTSTTVPCGPNGGCAAADACHVSACNPSTLACETTPKSCDDHDACTVDSCDAATGECVHAAMTCDPGNVCFAGACAPAFTCPCWAGKTAQQLASTLNVPRDQLSSQTCTTIPPNGVGLVASTTLVLAAVPSSFSGTVDGCLFGDISAAVAGGGPLPIVPVSAADFANCAAEANQLIPLVYWCGTRPPPVDIGICPTDGTEQACRGFGTSSTCFACAGGQSNLDCLGAATAKCVSPLLNAACANDVNLLTRPGSSQCALECGCPLVSGGDPCTGIVCAGGSICCGGACVTLATDEQNCGACGRQCAANEACLAGTCIPQLPGCPSLGTAEACLAYREGGSAACRACVRNAFAANCILAGDPQPPVFDPGCGIDFQNALCAYDVNREGCAAVCCPD